MIYAIVPVPKPRQTQSDKWKQRPSVLKYRAFADECRLKMVGVELNKSHITFYMPMPKSWNQARRRDMLGMPHCQRPDLDNLLKSLMDALLPEDSHVHEIHVRKLWDGLGAIEITEYDKCNYDDLPF